MAALVIEKNGVQDTVYTPLAVNLPFHASEAPNLLLYGGAGSGKSFCMRWDAYMRSLMIPEFRSLIVRRSMPELRLSHLERVPFEAARLGLPKEAWHATEFVLRFPNGSRLKFRHVEDDNALAEYLSSEFDAIYFDELVTFTQRQFLFLSSRARTDKPGIKPIVRAGTNPIGPGASWVKRMFIDKSITRDELPGYDKNDYESVFSTVEHNQYVDLNEYEKRLQSLPSEALRKAMRYGEWVQEGQAFSEWREAQPDGRGWHVIDRMPTYRGQPIQYADHIEVVRVVDWGYASSGNPGMCQWYACLTDGSAICFQEYVFKETLPADAANEIKRLSQGLRVRYTVGDTAMWQEHEGPSIAECFAVAGVSMVEADKAREAGWVNLHVWLRETVNDGLVQRPRLSFLRSGCPITIRTMPQMVVDPVKPMDIVTRGVEDEGADCSRYFVMSSSRSIEREEGGSRDCVDLQGHCEAQADRIADWVGGDPEDHVMQEQQLLNGNSPEILQENIRLLKSQGHTDQNAVMIAVKHANDTEPLASKPQGNDALVKNMPPEGIPASIFDARSKPSGKDIDLPKEPVKKEKK